MPEQVECNQRLVLPVEMSGTYDNPFDPADISHSARVVKPSGRTERVHGYFNQDFEPSPVGEVEEVLLPIQGPAWKIRYRARETDRHPLDE